MYLTNLIYIITWEVVLAFIGALAWLPWVFEKLNRSKIYGKVISYVVNKGNFNDRDGLLYFFKLSISCINKNFNVKDIRIKVLYPKANEWYDGKVFWSRRSFWVIENDQPQKQLVIPNDNFLGFINILEKDKSNFYYLTFIVENKEVEEYDRIRIEFTNHKNLTESFEVVNSDIQNDKILFDDSIWRN